MWRFYAGITYKYHSKWWWGKMFGLMELFHLIKIPQEQSVAFPGPPPLSGPPPNNSDWGYFQPKEAPRAVGPTWSTEHTAETWSPSVYYSSRIWNPLVLSASIQKEKEHELSFMKCGWKNKWAILGDPSLTLPIPGLKRLCWPEMHIPAPAPIPACQSELTKGAQWCVKIRNKNLERGHGGLELSEEDSDAIHIILNFQIVGSKPWLLASQCPSTAMCSPISRIWKRLLAIAETHTFVVIGKKCLVKCHQVKWGDTEIEIYRE